MQIIERSRVSKEPPRYELRTSFYYSDAVKVCVLSAKDINEVRKHIYDTYSWNEDFNMCVVFKIGRNNKTHLGTLYIEGTRIRTPYWQVPDHRELYKVDAWTGGLKSGGHWF